MSFEFLVSRHGAPRIAHRRNVSILDVNGNGIGHGRGNEAGYTLVMLVVIIAIMSISMGVAVQTASFQMQREREAELIFRGEQFVEAIRLYKIKYGRYPMRLKEIYEAKPRVIRKKWKDPITDSENWGLIFLGQEGGQLGQRGRQLAGPEAAADDDRQRSNLPIGTQPPTGGSPAGSEEDAVFGMRSGSGRAGDATGLGAVDADRKVGPIVGVHSTSCEESIKIYEGRTTYCEWRFIYREPNQRGRGGGNVPGPQRPTPDLPFGVPPDAMRTPGAGGGSSGGGPEPPPPIRTPPRP
jgi:type II secretory pathway pseudopilin PulG